MKDIIKSIEDAQLKPEVDSFRVGDTVRVSAKVVEGSRERIQVFEGTVIKRQNGGAKETFTVRKFSNGVGVEKTWPLHSPIVTKIQVVRKGKVRRAKLYYLRDRIGKRAKVKEIVKLYHKRPGRVFILALFFHTDFREKVKADEKLSLFRKKKHDDSPNRSLGWRSCCSNPVSIFSDSVLLSDSNRTRRLHAAGIL